jgi:hypothetical protein
MKITDLAYDSRSPRGIANPWRADLQRARFRKAYFHVDGAAVDSGRRIVMHEFPKKNVPYAEDMGRKAFEFTVRGYCISYVRDVDPGKVDGSLLYNRDYRLARDFLADELSSGEPGLLYLPTFKGREVEVICPRYRLTEDEKTGGFCTFDMTFVELGKAPSEGAPNSRDDLLAQFEALRQRTIDALAAETEGPLNV